MQPRFPDVTVLRPIESEIDAATRLAIAALVGLGVGLEREWSGHTTGPEARFAGLRTLFLLGVLGGVAGMLLSGGYANAGAAMVAGGMALSVAAYVVTARRSEKEVDGTTEAAALAVVGLGTIAGGGWLALSAGAGSIIVLALREKKRLHWLVRRFSESELRAALQFAVLALVVLPLLPRGPFGGPLEIQPRTIWTLVLFFSALNFAGFLARRAVGAGAGYTLTGLLGGMISSTGVTLDFARRSRAEPDLGGPLALGVIGACTVLLPRVVVVSTTLNPRVAPLLALLLAPPAVVGAGLLLLGRKLEHDTTHTASEDDRANPLRLRVAIPMALAFQASISALAMSQHWWGDMSLYPAAAVLGLSDVDALTVSISRIGDGVSPVTAARALAVGVLANTLLKTGLAAGAGVGRFRVRALGGLLALAVASALGLAFSFSDFWPALGD